MTFTECLGCGELIKQPRSGRRKWCSERCRKQQYAGRCRTCGAKTNGSNGSARAASECLGCRSARLHAERRWTPEAVIAAIRAHAAELGRAPGAKEAEKRFGALPTSAEREFGSWSAALVASGLPARPQGSRIDPDAWYENVTGRSRQEMDDLMGRVATMYQAGASLDLCASTFGLSSSTVRLHLSARGVQIRRPGRPKAVRA